MSKRKQFKRHDDRRRSFDPGRSPRPNRDVPGPEATEPAANVGRPSHAAQPGAAFWIYGVHPVLEVLGNKDRRINRLIAVSDMQDQISRRLSQAERDHSYPIAIEQLDRAALDRLLPAGSVHQGVAVLVQPLERPDIYEVCGTADEAGSRLLLVLDQVTDPHNVGAILRSAAAFGAWAVIVTERNSASESGVLAKAASGALEHVPLVPVTNLARAMAQMKEAGFWCIGLAAEAAETLGQIDLSGRVAIILGAEGAGLRRLTRDSCDKLARLPTGGPIAQLNVSNAAAIALYEVARRRPDLLLAGPGQ